MVAAIIAHEIGHIVKKHGLQSIQQSRVTDALGKLALTGAKIAGSPEVAELTTIFEGSIGDITKTLVVNGYSQSFEFEADGTSARLLKNVGYDPFALIQVLQIMEKQLKPGGLDFAKTHPEPGDRISNVRGEVGKDKPDTSTAPERTKRFKEFKSLI
jgi:predicted Zn-dependent protease